MTFPRSLELLDKFKVPADFPFYISRNRIAPFYPSHRHDCLELSLVLSGEGTETINGISHPMSAGTFTFVLPYQVHELHSFEGSPLVLYNCMFAPEFLLSAYGGQEELQELLFNRRSDERRYLLLAGGEFARMGELMGEMLLEFAGTHSWRKPLLQAKLTETLIRFERLSSAASAASGSSAAPAPSVRSASSARKHDIPAGGRTRSSPDMWQVLMYMHRHYREPLTLRALAGEFHRNETYLCEQIKEHFGQTFVELLHEIRVRHASALLVSTSLKLADIAEEAGFGSTASLFRIFRRLRGVSPTEFRQQYG
ncbi:MAG: transcriptional regulator, AraC family [Paenibacillaceae bacterium]|jgi:AraC-like DNA-binding protein|nr:transcriptional regulator, AraC family [Paenibacillaceae bacterium]